VTRITDQSIKTLDGKASAITGEVARSTDAALGAIDTKGTALARAVLANSDEIVRLITQASSNATAAVGKSLSEFEDKAKLAIEKSQRTSTSAVAEMLETHSMLRNDTTALFERLREANTLLQDVLGGANESLGRIENTLSVRVKEFVSALSDINERSASASDHVEQQIKSFHVLTAGVLTDISSMAERFEEQGLALTNAASNLDQSHRHIESTLGQRHEALTTVVGQLGSTTENLDQRFNRFSMLLQESLSAAENRAREIARLIADSSTEGTRAITNQYDLVRSTTEDERQRTIEALRTVFETTATETQTLFHAAGDRFKDAVKEMRESAATMHRELENTREQLRKGILELPKDTAESTAQMRRVIVEQMDALAELNRIVARHGRSMDTVEPVRVTAREEALTMAGAPASRPVTRPETPIARPSTPIARSRSEGRGGWLSDVLNRASREEAPPIHEEEPHSGGNGRSSGSLDSISLDIARMVEHDAVAELWDQRQHGERAPVARRLYTLQGQQTFEDIRKKYRGDRDFKQTVDRYIAEFERLLDEVSNDDRNPGVAKSYLTSETGKVYTMLAHAAGRLE
jgi:hypothetical protein